MSYFLNLLHHEFVQNAYLAGAIVAITCAMIGYFVVLRSQAFASEAFSDIGFAGSAGAALLGINALLGMIGVTVLAALGIGALGDRLRGRDVEVGMVLSFALGLGVLFLVIYTQVGTNASVGVNVLFGSIVSVTRFDVWISLLFGTGTLLTLAWLFRPLLFISVDPEMALARGVPVRLLAMIFLVLMAVTAAQAMLVVGALLVLALLVAPAASALHLTNRPLYSLTLAIGLGLLITLGGLTLAFVGPGSRFPAGFWITSLSALCYFVTLPYKTRRQAKRVAMHPVHTHPCNEYSELQSRGH